MISLSSSEFSPVLPFYENTRILVGASLLLKSPFKACQLPYKLVDWVCFFKLFNECESIAFLRINSLPKSYFSILYMALISCSVRMVFKIQDKLFKKQHC